MIPVVVVLLAALTQGQALSGKVLSHSRAVVRPSTRHDVSPPLRTIPPKHRGSQQVREIPLHRLPKAKPAAPGTRRPSTSHVDAALQTAPVTAAMPSTQVNFEGISNLNGVLPPDTNGAIGPNHYVQIVNLSIAVYDRSGNLLLGPVDTNTLWSGFGGPCETYNDGDPIVLYDRFADRWLVSQFALFAPDGYHQCIAISQSGDPTSAYYRYDFLFSPTKMNDYPKFSVWPDGYYMSANQFDDSGWAGAGVVAFDRAKMLQGLPAQMIYFDLFDVNPNFGGLLPSDVDGIAPPPPGSPNYFAEMDDDAWGWPSDELQIFQFHVDWSNPANSSFTGPQVIDLTAAGYPFDSDLCGGSGSCIPQPGGTPVDPLSDRLMYRLAYRNFGDHESLVVNHTVDVDGTDHAGIRWYEVRNPGGSPPTLYQAGTFAPDSDDRWMGSIAMDSAGNIALGYSVSSTTTYPSIRYAGRVATDPLGTLAQSETTLIAGGGSQSHPAARWGDYSRMAVDPVDDCTFWYTQEYYALDSDAGWQTRVGAFRFPTCNTAVPVGYLQGIVSDATTAQPIPNASVQFGVFSTVTDADGHYMLTALPGTAGATASASGYYPQTASAVVVSSGATTAEDFTLTLRPLVNVNGTVSDGSGHGWPLYARIEINGNHAKPVFTNPYTGAFSIELPEGEATTFAVQAISPGYQPHTTTVTPALGVPTDFVLLADQTSCTAPGYGHLSAKLSGDHTVYSQSFETSNGGYAVKGTNPSWSWGSSIYGAHSGTRVWATSLNAGQYFNNEQSYITSPNIDLSGYAGKVVFLSWWQILQTLLPDYATVEVSRDGGSTWRVARRSNGIDGWGTGWSSMFWTQYFYRLDAADIVSNFRVRFTLQSDATNLGRGFYLDDVQIHAYDSEQVADSRLFELFNGQIWPPQGWAISTTLGHDWQPRGSTAGMNMTGGDGAYALASWGSTNTVLRTPPINLSGLSNPVLQFHSYYDDSGNSQTADVDVSNDGGSTWNNVWRRQGVAQNAGPEQADLSAYAGAPNLLVRFHSLSVDYAAWGVDDVRVGAPADLPTEETCGALPGGLVVGNVRDANSGLGLNGATVAGDQVPIDHATTVATPDDPNVDDGLYILFSSLTGSQPFTASKFAYADSHQTVGVTTDTVVQQDFSMSAGMLQAQPGSLEVTLQQGTSTTVQLMLNNTGSSAATFKIFEGHASTSAATSSVMPISAIGTDAGDPGEPSLQQGPNGPNPGVSEAPPTPPVPAVAGDVVTQWTSQDYTWGIAFEGDSQTLWLSSPAISWGGNDTLYEYTPDGHKTPRSHPNAWLHTYGPADAAFNWNTGMIWQMDVASDNCIHEIDPALGVTGSRICPAFPISERGLAYDPTNDTWFAGGWNDRTIYHFDSSGNILEQVNVGMGIAGLAYNPDTHHLFVSVQPGGSGYVYVLDVTNHFAVVDYIEFGGDVAWGSGLEIGCDGKLWFVGQDFAPGNPISTVYQIDVGETTSVCQQDVGWLSEAPMTGTVAAGSSQTVQVTFDGAGAEVTGPGTYKAVLRVSSNTPYSRVLVPVTMNVQPNANAPVANNDGFTLDEGGTLTVSAPGVLGNDADPNGNPLTAILYSSPTHGTATLEPDGSFTYTPATLFYGSDNFTYRANNGTYNSDVATVTVTVNHINHPPVANGDAYYTSVNRTLTISAPGVLANDTDVDGDPLTAVLVSTTSHGSLSLAANGSFTYTPKANFFGSDSFTYMASDGTVSSNLATVSLTVIEPVAKDDAYSTNKDGALTISAPGVLANDTDADGDPLTAVLVSTTSHGSLSLAANGSFNYTPNANFSGNDSFTYEANDGEAGSNVATVTITIDSPAVMLSPTPESKLTSSTPTFQWDSGTGVTGFTMYVGTSQGASNLYKQFLGLSHSQMVDIPTSAAGGYLYVRLWSDIAGVWKYNDYRYTAAGTGIAATMSSPGAGTKFSSTSMTFSWGTGTGVSAYTIWAGTTQGSSNIVNRFMNTARTTTITIPATGGWVYVRLWSYIAGVWKYNDYRYTAAGTGVAATMSSPGAGTKFSNTSVTFSWGTGTGVSAYTIWAGTTQGSSNIVNRFMNTARTTTITIPATGGWVYVRLWSYIAGVWKYNDYRYTAAGTGMAATMSSPVPNTTIHTRTVTFSWTTGTGVSSYTLYIGTTPGGSQILNKNTGLNRSLTANNLPASSTKIYLRLWSLIAGTWKYKDYIYTSAP